MLVEKNQIGKREDLADYITRVDAKSKPVLSLIPKGPEVTNTLVQFQVDDYEAPEDNAAPDGEDIGNFDNATANRVLLKTYVQKFWDSAMVSDFAENVSNVAGVKSELKESVMKKLEKLSRDIECALCSDNEHQEGNGDIPYKLRGLGMWIGAGSSQTTFQVPTDYQTPAASLDTTAMASLTETIIQNVLQSSYEQTGRVQRFVLVCGPTLKRQFTNFTRTQFASANTAATIRTYGGQADDKKIVSAVDFFEGDFGSVELLPSLWLAKFTSAAATARRGYLIVPDLLELRYKRYPRVVKQEDRGGGPRVLLDAILTLVCKNPLPFGKFSAAS